MKQYGRQKQLKVCQSAAGYYIGTLDLNTGAPVSRQSLNYYSTPEEAQKALEDGSWKKRKHP